MVFMDATHYGYQSLTEMTLTPRGAATQRDSPVKLDVGAAG